MNTQTLEQKVAQKFKTPDGQIVDVIFTTSDGEMHFSLDDAAKASAKLEDKNIVPHYRDPQVREMGKVYLELQKMIFVTDYLKLAKLQRRKNSSYAEYLQVAKESSMGVVSEVAYKFVFSKVFTVRKMLAVGQKDTIYTYDKGVVEAYFLRRYDHGQIWQLGDDLIFTCPTNTQLGKISHYDIFHQLLGPDPRKAKKIA